MSDDGCWIIDIIVAVICGLAWCIWHLILGIAYLISCSIDKCKEN